MQQPFMPRMLGEVVKALFVLLLAPPAPEEGTARGGALRGSYPGVAPAYAEIDLGELRRVVADSDEIGELLHRGMEPAQSLESAAATVALLTGAKTEEVKSVFAGARRVGVSLLSFGEREHQFRFLAVADMGRDVLDGLLANARALPGYDAREYAGGTLYGFHTGRGRGVWLAERGGKVAVGTDPLVVQRFILAPSEASPQGIAEPAGPALLTVDADGEAFFRTLFTVLGRGDRDEFLLASAFFDFPALKGARARFDGRRLEVRLDIDPRSRLARALRAPAGAPRLLGAVRDGCGLALVASLENPGEAWEVVKEAVRQEALMSGRGGGAGLVEEIRRELGFDPGEVAGMVSEGAFIVPAFETERDLERRSVLAFRVRDPAAVEGAIAAFAAAVAGGAEVAPRANANATVWQAGPRTKIALAGDVVLVGPEPGSPVDSVLAALRRPRSALAEELERRHPAATSFALVDLARILAGVPGAPAEGMDAFSVGLRFERGSLVASAEIDADSLVGPVVGLVERRRALALRAQCTANIRMVYYACRRYASRKRELPPDLEAAKGQIGTRARFVCPATGKPYVYVKELAGKKIEDFPNRASVVIAHDEPGAHGEGGCVVYLSGRAVWLADEEIEKAVAETRKQLEEAKPERADDEPVEVF